MMLLKKLALFFASTLLFVSSLACNVGAPRQGEARSVDASAPASPDNAANASPALSPASAQTSAPPLVFRGDIGGRHKIQMRLRREGDALSGSYFYEGRLGQLTLRGTIDREGKFTLQEFDEQGRQSGVFKGEWKDTGDFSLGILLEGEWSKPDGTGTLGFVFEEFPVELTNGASFGNETIKEDNKKQKYAIDVEYPQLKGAASPALSDFNAQVKRLVTGEVARFRKDVNESRDFPAPSESGSSLDIGYTVGLATNDLVSIQLSIGTYFRGAAHPNNESRTLNYDLRGRRLLRLADLFKPASRYLQAISEYCLRDLQKQNKERGDDGLSDTEWMKKGTAPKLENYESWLITRKGLAVTFDAYQVAPYAAGPQFVTIPYAALREIIGEDSILRPFVK